MNADQTDVEQTLFQAGCGHFASFVQPPIHIFEKNLTGRVQIPTAKNA